MHEIFIQYGQKIIDFFVARSVYAQIIALLTWTVLAIIIFAWFQNSLYLIIIGAAWGLFFAGFVDFYILKWCRNFNAWLKERAKSLDEKLYLQLHRNIIRGKAAISNNEIVLRYESPCKTMPFYPRYYNIIPYADSKIFDSYGVQVSVDDKKTTKEVVANGIAKIVLVGNDLNKLSNCKEISLRMKNAMTGEEYKLIFNNN